MNNSTSSNPESNPDPAATSADQAQPMVPQRAAGSTLQNAAAATQNQQPTGTPLEHPIATNFADTKRPGTAKTAGVSATDGPYETAAAADQPGQVSWHNNPNPPDDEDVQVQLPDTDPISRPIDQETNLPS